VSANTNVTGYGIAERAAALIRDRQADLTAETRLPTGITDEASGSRSRSAQPRLACLNAYP
jgi:hypothetical protein